MDIFTNIELVNKALDATMLKKSLITQNISNANTPYYKRKDIDFESVLEKEISRKGVQNLDLNELEPKIYTDNKNLSYRMDGNNVDINVEETEEAKVQLRYNTLITRVSAQLGRFKTVLQNLR